MIFICSMTSLQLLIKSRSGNKIFLWPSRATKKMESSEPERNDFSKASQNAGSGTGADGVARGSSALGA